MLLNIRESTETDVFAHQFFLFFVFLCVCVYFCFFLHFTATRVFPHSTDTFFLFSCRFFSSFFSYGFCLHSTAATGFVFVRQLRFFPLHCTAIGFFLHCTAEGFFFILHLEVFFLMQLLPKGCFFILQLQICSSFYTYM